MPVKQDVLYAGEIPVILKRTRRKGATLSFRDNQFYLSASLLMPRFELERFLNSKQSWMIKQMAHPRRNVKIKWEDGSDVYILGERKILRLIPASRSHVVLNGDFLFVYGPSQAAMEKSFRKFAEEQLDVILDGFRRELTYPVGDYLLNYRFYTSRWGCCNKRTRQITMNLWCIGLPLEGIRYIYCHELAHLKVSNHQKAFYSHLAEILPNYRSGLRLTKDYIIS